MNPSIESARDQGQRIEGLSGSSGNRRKRMALIAGSAAADFQKEAFLRPPAPAQGTPVNALRRKQRRPPPVFHLPGFEIDNITMEDAVAMIETNPGREKQCCIFFVNPDCLNKTISEVEYRSVLKSSDHIFPDDVGGLFDFYSGNNRRALRWIREIGSNGFTGSCRNRREYGEDM